MRKFLVGLFLVIHAGTSTAGQEANFMAMRKAFLSGNAGHVIVYGQRLQGHALEPYAAYYRLRGAVINLDAIKKFISRYPDSPLSDRLRSDWLKALGKAQQWELFAEEYPNLIGGDMELTCYSLQQRLAAQDRKGYEEARPLWFSARDLPESCTPLFKTLMSADVLTTEDIWARLRLTLEAGNVGVARWINEYLPEGQGLSGRKLAAATDNPLRYLESQRHSIKTRGDREIALFAMLRLVRNGPDQAYAYWPRLRGSFSEKDHAYFMAQLADQAARRLHPNTLSWFAEAAKTRSPAVLTDDQLGWKARTMLRAGDWDTVLDTIDAMSPREQRAGVWRYWKARALKAAGKTTDANAILAPLSNEHNFYGQLAEEELGVAIGPSSAPHKVTPAEIAAIERLPSIQRSLILYRLNLRPEAALEWAWAIKDLDDHRLLAAAEVARRKGIYDRAIHTAEKTVQHHDFNLRFLTPHRDTLRGILKQQELELDEAWVYGLIRQESRFMSDARSSAGAMGLMQLMPGTAKWVAKRLGMKKYRNALATEVNTNLKLGTYYLKHVLTMFDNQPMLASAAYNAGPSRVGQWRAEKAMEGAIYAETIPFNETRDYVKKVMSNSMYYASTLGHRVKPLKQRLGTVASNQNMEKMAKEDVGP
ncbi:MAG: transglycosylase [Nitrosospira sp. 56-18]|jgi:soluble lytic murein transglycosylase|nr:lytic transglycosylase domain-containing protein [Nitrosospira sp.]OJY08021.1 MAG: transglycosylase [Nitrosospira sp. 56-18]